MGAALTYARRYALFALVGIAGEDDLDAPEPAITSNSREPQSPTSSQKHLPGGILHRPPTLNQLQSAAERDAMLAELHQIDTEEPLIAWAQNAILRKNKLAEADAVVIEMGYQRRLIEIDRAMNAGAALPGDQENKVTDNKAQESAPALAFPKEPIRQRSKAHLLFVGSKPCLICHQMPADAHHLKFAQRRALSRKVSDEFTVPLCRTHHQDLHRSGNEQAWWNDKQIQPLQVANQLWRISPIHHQATTADNSLIRADARLG